MLSEPAPQGKRLPSRNDWDAFFKSAQNRGKPGEKLIKEDVEGKVKVI